MAIRIENKSQIEAIKGEVPTHRFLFFIPKELWMADDAHEGHGGVLEASGRLREDVAVAGSIWYFNNLEIDGKGSQTLEIEPRDPAPVIEFVNSLGYRV